MFGDMVTGFSGEIEKLGARVGLRMIKRLVAKGTPEAMAEAERLAKLPGVLKDLPGGHSLKLLGKPGAEGAAQLVAGARSPAAGGRGLAVKKIYDINSPIASPEVIRRKVQLSRDIKHPRIAETFGAGKERGRPVSFHEYAMGRSPTGPELTAMKPEIQDALLAARKKGWVLGDVRGPNIVGGKIIDPMPFRQGEFMYQIRNRMYPTMEGGSIMGMGTQMGTAGERFTKDFVRHLSDPAVAARQQAQRHVRKVRGARAGAGEAAQQKVVPPPRPRRPPQKPKRPKPKPEPPASEAINPPYPMRDMPGGAGARPGAAPGAGAGAGAGPQWSWSNPWSGAEPNYSQIWQNLQPSASRSREWVGPAVLGGGLGLLAGGLHYARKKRKAKLKAQAQAKAAPMKKAASVERWAWEHGLRDEFQKISSFAGLVLSQLARREVAPPVMGAVSRAEEAAARKLEALKASKSPTDFALSQVPF